MVRRRLKRFYAKEAMDFLNHMMKDKPLLPFLIPLGLFAWAIERWLVPFSNWVPLAAAVWATIQVSLSCFGFVLVKKVRILDCVAVELWCLYVEFC